MLIEVPISDSMRKSASKRAQELGTLNRSIREGEGNLIGFLGEEILSFYYNMVPANTYDYDLILDDTWRIDAKTKEVTTEPKPEYECSLGTYYKQNCDFFVFLRILNTLDKGWILGYSTPEEYYRQATLHKKGDLDTSNNFVFKSDAYNLPISQLFEINWT